MIGERRREDIFESYDDEFDINDKSTWPAIIVSTTIEAGMEYAKILGIKNYMVSNDLSKIQGVRPRAVIPTPAYLTQVEQAAWAARAGYDAAMLGFYKSDITLG